MPKRGFDRRARHVRSAHYMGALNIPDEAKMLPMARAWHEAYAFCPRCAIRDREKMGPAKRPMPFEMIPLMSMTLFASRREPSGKTLVLRMPMFKAPAK